MSESVWAQAMASLAAGGDRLAAIMRERGGEADAADVYATMLGVLSDGYLSQIGVQPEHPVFVPCTGYFQRLGTPNPDTMYRAAPVDDQGIYRIVGNRGTAGDVTLMAFSAAMRSWPAVNVAQFCDTDGSFDLIVSAERPDGHTGHWMKLEEGSATLWLRSVSDRWDVEDDPWIGITRLDGGSRRRMSAEWLEKRLIPLAKRVEGATEYGIKHVGELIDQGFVNSLKLIDYSTSGAMPLQSYHEGVFELADDEVLLVEARMPAECHYFSWSLCDAMFVTLDWTNAFASINSGQAARDADGVLRVVVSAQDPGIANWLQTTGHVMGVVQARTVGSATMTEMTAEVVPLSELPDRLPVGLRTVTADERRKALQERQIAAQRRRLW